MKQPKESLKRESNLSVIAVARVTPLRKFTRKNGERHWVEIRRDRLIAREELQHALDNHCDSLDHVGTDVLAEPGEYDGFPFRGALYIGPYSVLIFSQ